MNPLLTPRDWQMTATKEAADLVGTDGYAAKMVEARRYGLMADEIERLRTKPQQVEISGGQRAGRTSGMAAAKTLATLGYTYHGGELWKPPLGTPPVGINGLTEAETSASASVMGLIASGVGHKAQEWRGGYSGSGGPISGATDPLYQQAIAIVREHKRGSISLVQRVLRIGFNRAACMLEAMEKDGIITPWGPGGMTGRDLVQPAEGGTL